jgi:mannose-6-phosphate isomerase-like protein (cupin superfamily)
MHIHQIDNPLCFISTIFVEGDVLEKKKWITVLEAPEYRKIGGLVKRLVHPMTTGSKNLGVSICILNPGEEIIVHQHDFEEAYFVMEGEGVMTLEDEEIQLEEFLSVYIPANARHGQKNTGNRPLLILCSLAPPPEVW